MFTQRGAARRERPLWTAGPALALAFGILVAHGAEGASGGGKKQFQQSAHLEGAISILYEALEDARKAKDPWYQAISFIEISAASQDLDVATSTQSLEEAIEVVPRLPEGPGFVSRLLEVASLAGEIWGGFSLLSPSLGALRSVSSYGVFLATRHALVFSSSVVQSELAGYYTTAIRRIALKEQLSIQLVRLLASKDPRRALELALLVKDESTRALGVSVALAAWPSGTSSEITTTVQKLAADNTGSDPSPEFLAALADGLAAHDASIARDLARRAAAGQAQRKVANEAVYAIVAALDRRAAESLLSSLADSRDGDAPFRLGAFARSVASSQPDLAWRALSSIDSRSEKLWPLRAAVLRQIARQLPSDLRPSALEAARTLLSSAAAKGDWEEGPLYPVWDALMALDYLEAGSGLVELGRVTSGRFEGFILGNAGSGFMYYGDEYRMPKVGFLNKTERQELREFKERHDTVKKTFLPNLIRLDLAISWIQSDPARSLSVLETFDDLFWRALAAAALQRAAFEGPEVHGLPGFDDPPGTETIEARLTRLVAEVRLKWVAAARLMQDSNPSAAKSTLLKFAKAAESMDRAASRVIMDKRGKTAGLWLDYLPFSQTVAGSALVELAPEAASEVFRSSVQLAKELTSPAREWALCWNAEAWVENTHSEEAHAAMAEAARDAADLNDHKPWEGLLPNLVYRVARMDPGTALRIARSEEARDVRALALTAVVVGITEERR